MSKYENVNVTEDVTCGSSAPMPKLSSQTSAHLSVNFETLFSFVQQICLLLQLFIQYNITH